jgi:hypothetical protein
MRIWHTQHIHGTRTLDEPRMYVGEADTTVRSRPTSKTRKRAPTHTPTYWSMGGGRQDKSFPQKIVTGSERSGTFRATSILEGNDVEFPTVSVFPVLECGKYATV